MRGTEEGEGFNVKTHNIRSVKRIKAPNQKVHQREGKQFTHFLLNTGVAEDRTVCDRCCLSSPSPSIPHI